MCECAKLQEGKRKSLYYKLHTHTYNYTPKRLLSYCSQGHMCVYKDICYAQSADSHHPWIFFAKSEDGTNSHFAHNISYQMNGAVCSIQTHKWVVMVILVRERRRGEGLA